MTWDSSWVRLPHFVSRGPSCFHPYFNGQTPPQMTNTSRTCSMLKSCMKYVVYDHFYKTRPIYFSRYCGSLTTPKGEKLQNSYHNVNYVEVWSFTTLVTESTTFKSEASELVSQRQQRRKVRSFTTPATELTTLKSEASELLSQRQRRRKVRSFRALAKTSRTSKSAPAGTRTSATPERVSRSIRFFSLWLLWFPSCSNSYRSSIIQSYFIVHFVLFFIFFIQ